jgi:hypothetical protein
MNAALIEPCRMKGKEARLQCWTCNRTRLERLAVDWHTVIDFRYQRKLVFCCLKCQQGALTKTGLWRRAKPR